MFFFQMFFNFKFFEKEILRRPFQQVKNPACLRSIRLKEGVIDCNSTGSEKLSVLSS